MCPQVAASGRFREVMCSLRKAARRRNPAVENGNRFTRRRGGAENGPLEGRRAIHRLATGYRGRKAREQPLSPRSPRLRVRLLMHGYG
jgi:hypothetical protein